MLSRMLLVSLFIYTPVYAIDGVKSEAQEIPAAAAAKQEGAAPGKQVLANYADQKITFEEFAAKEPVLVSWFGLGATVEQVETTLEGLIFADLLAKEGEASGLLQEESVRNQVNAILANAYLKKHAPKSAVEVTAQEVEDAYRANLDRYKHHDKIGASHILVASDSEAQKIRSRLDAGEKFADIARALSKDLISAERGGSLGTVSPLYLLPPLRESLENLKAGAVGSPVKSPFGYHLMRLDHRPAPSYRPLEEVKQEIYEQIFQEKETALREEIKKKLFEKYSVAFSDEAIRAVVKEEAAKNVKIADVAASMKRREPGQPSELQLITESIDIGKIPAKEMSGSLMIANASDRVINIERVGSTCNCIKASISQTALKPGQVETLSFTYNPDMFNDNGAIERLLFIESSDVISPRKFVKFHAEIVREKE